MSELAQRPRSDLSGTRPLDFGHDDGRLMHDLSQVNAAVTKYILAHLDADAGRTPAMATADEMALGEKLRMAGDAIQRRAARRDNLGA